jgi:hypothetical protein
VDKLKAMLRDVSSIFLVQNYQLSSIWCMSLKPTFKIRMTSCLGPALRLYKNAENVTLIRVCLKAFEMLFLHLSRRVTSYTPDSSPIFLIVLSFGLAPEISISTKNVVARIYIGVCFKICVTPAYELVRRNSCLDFRYLGIKTLLFYLLCEINSFSKCRACVSKAKFQFYIISCLDWRVIS